MKLTGSLKLPAIKIRKVVTLAEEVASRDQPRERGTVRDVYRILKTVGKPILEVTGALSMCPNRIVRVAARCCKIYTSIDRVLGPFD
jgi:hypothetical protein